jgi:hypothetical protein
VVVVTDGGETTVRVSDRVPATPLWSVAATVKVCVLAAPPTLPEITPVLEARLRPAGSDPLVTLQVSDPVPPVAVSVWE